MGANDNVGSAIYFSKSRGTSDGAVTVVQDGDQLGSLFFHGADGTDHQSRAAAITCDVDGTPGSNDLPGRLEFATTADGATSPTERMRIDSSGNIGIGADNPSAWSSSANNLVVSDTAKGIFF